MTDVESYDKEKMPGSASPSICEFTANDEITEREARRSLLGPYSLLLSMSGFDLEHSLFGKKEHLARSIICTLIFFLLAAPFLLHIINLWFLTQIETLTYGWVEANITLCMGVHGLASAIALAIWSASRLFSTFQSALLDVQRHYPPTATPSSSSTLAWSLVLGGCLVAHAFAVAAKVVLQGKFAPNAEHTPAEWALSMENLFGLEPFIIVWMSIASGLAVTIYVRLHIHAKRELTVFNDLLNEARDRGTLADNLPTLAAHHASLLSLVSLLSLRITCFASFSTLTMSIAVTNLFVLISSPLAMEMNAFSVAVILLWIIVAATLLLFTLGQPAILQGKLHTAASIIINDPTLLGNQEKMALASLLVARTRTTPTQVRLCAAIPLTPAAPHLAVLIFPNVGTIIGIIRRFHTD